MRISTLVLASCLVLACGSDATTGDPDPDPLEVDAGVDVLPNPPFANCAGETGGQPGNTFPGTMVCFADVAGDPTAPPVSVIEHNFEDYMGTPAVHIRLTFDPNFADNTYGVNAVGWDPDDHKFKDLTGSDHAQILMLDANGEIIFDIEIDYIEADDTAPCGFASGGVTDGNGKVNVGDEALILAVTTSLDQNLNERGYCLTEDSPVTDENCTPDPLYPDWDFRVVYEVWVAVSAFDPAGFGSTHMDNVHASPAKGGENTVVVEPSDCPEDLCNNPDGCEQDPGGSCQDVGECAADEFCYEGTCLPIVQ